VFVGFLLPRVHTLAFTIDHAMVCLNGGLTFVRYNDSVTCETSLLSFCQKSAHKLLLSHLYNPLVVR